MLPDTGKRRTFLLVSVLVARNLVFPETISGQGSQVYSFGSGLLNDSKGLHRSTQLYCNSDFKSGGTTVRLQQTTVR